MQTTDGSAIHNVVEARRDFKHPYRQVFSNGCICELLKSIQNIHAYSYK